MLTTIDEAFTAALDLPADDRPAFLAQIRRDDPDLHDVVQRLLRSSEETASSLAPGGAQTGAMWRDLRTQLVNEGELRNGDLIGRFRIIREIGRGGMAVVYLAEREDRCYEHHVALKLLTLGIDTDEVVRRFAQERQILASLKHPAIARLVDGGKTATGRPFFVMEYVDGQPIDTYCAVHNLGINERLGLFLSVARAVSYAHRNLIVHRDLKPPNILVSDDGRVKLLDFGIAKLLAEGEYPFAAPPTRAGVRAMTPEYASPEQILGDKVTTSTDVYQLGLLLFELLTGRCLHRLSGRAAADVERVICEQAPPLPSVAVASNAIGTTQDPLQPTSGSLRATRRNEKDRLRRVLRGDLDAIVVTALQTNPMQRYSTVEQLCQDIEHWLRREPVTVRSSAVGYRLKSFVRRNSRAVISAATIFLLILSLTIFYTTRLARERDQARAEAVKAEQISSFIIQVFEGADPGRARGQRVTARELLDRGAQQVSTELGGQPRLQGELLLLFAEINCELGSSDRAMPLLEEALKLSQESNGRAGWRLRVMTMLARLYQAQGRFVEAEPLLGRAHTIAESAFGPDHAAKPEVLKNLSRLSDAQERLQASTAPDRPPDP